MSEEFSVAKLRVVRRKSMVGAANTTVVTLNNSETVSMKNGEEAEFTLTRRNNTLTVRIGMNSFSMSFDAPENGVGTVEYTITKFLSDQPVWTSQAVPRSADFGDSRPASVPSSDLSADSAAPAAKLTKTRQRTKWISLSLSVIFFCMSAVSLPIVIFRLMRRVKRTGDILPYAIAGGVALILGIVFLIVYLRKTKGKPELRAKLPVKLAFAAFSLIACVALIMGIVSGVRQVELNNTVKVIYPPHGEFVMPENPKFVFYSSEEHWLYYPDKGHYSCAAENPDEVNVIVVYHSEVHRSGKWVNSKTGDKVRDSYVQEVRLSVKLRENGAEETLHNSTFTKRTDSPNEENPQTWPEVRKAVNYFMGHGEDMPKDKD